MQRQWVPHGCHGIVISTTCCIFSVFFVQKTAKSKRVRNLLQNLAKTDFLSLHPQTLVEGFIFQKKNKLIWLSTYLHRDVGYGIPSQTDKAQGAKRTFITPGQHRHVNITKKEEGGRVVGWSNCCLMHFVSPAKKKMLDTFFAVTLDQRQNKKNCNKINIQGKNQINLENSIDFSN